MSDIVERLRNWRTVHLTQLRYVMESAADEIERLRKAPCPHVVGTTTHYCSLTPSTLTEKERKAIGWAIAECESMPVDLSREAAATLRSILSRIGDCPVPENAANQDNESVRKAGGSHPVAWRVYADDGSETVRMFYEQARAAADEWNWSVEPLFRQPTLTDEEREVLLAIEADASYRAMKRTERVVRRLLERLG